MIILNEYAASRTYYLAFERNRFYMVSFERVKGTLFLMVHYSNYNIPDVADHYSWLNLTLYERQPAKKFIDLAKNENL